LRCQSRKKKKGETKEDSEKRLKKKDRWDKNRKVKKKKIVRVGEWKRMDGGYREQAQGSVEEK